MKEEKTRPGPSARDDVLIQLSEYQKEIESSDQWSKEEKEELLKFLRIQATGWGMLVDDIRSEQVRRTKERMLLESWRKFTEDMNIKGESGLEGRLSSTETVVQEEVINGIQTAVGTEKPLNQT